MADTLTAKEPPRVGGSPLSDADGVLAAVRADPLGSRLLDGYGAEGYGRWDAQARTLCRLAENLTHCDARTLDGAFRASPLMRPEWDEAGPDGLTFGEATIRDIVPSDGGDDGAGPRDQDEALGRDQVGADGGEDAPGWDEMSALPFVPLGAVTGPRTPEAPPTLIDGLLGRGETMLLSAPSKAGKSWLAISMAYGIATGSDWLGFGCRKGHVAYANLEIGGTYFARRCEAYRRAAGLRYDPDIKIDVLNARGLMLDATSFSMGVEARYRDGGLDVMVVDCAYMLESGSENDVEAVRPLLTTLGSLCRSLGCSLVLIHHQAKYGAAGKSVTDRMAGSGAFARWPDVIADLSPIDASGEPEVSEQLREQGYRALRLSFECRNARSPEPIELIFTGTRFLRDESGSLAGCPLSGSPTAAGARGGAAASRATEATRERRTDLLRDGIRAARDAGTEPTRAFLLDYYNGHAASHGLPEVTRATLTKWTQASNESMPFRLDGHAVVYDG